ncbi:SHSP domain-containing protein [Plasmodiophora brassicae]|uniref:SHSP domain-containing protein n=1 Tax=Plasmodiophora brassicae TaxID=37360 RepID=A0A3P3YLP0_PLABS|nr:unnamed protein product [Plasmodiophora brassicae]
MTSLFSNLLLGRSRMMAMELIEKPDAYVVKVDIPGLRKEDVNLQLVDNYLTVTRKEKEAHERGEGREVKPEAENVTVLFNERDDSEVSRTLRLPRDVDKDTVHARYDLGQLCICIKKQAESRGTVVNIE